MDVLNCLKDFDVVLLSLRVSQNSLQPNSQKNKNKNTQNYQQSLTETWVAALAGDTNCLMRCPMYSDQ